MYLIYVLHDVTYSCFGCCILSLYLLMYRREIKSLQNIAMQDPGRARYNLKQEQ